MTYDFADPSTPTGIDYTELSGSLLMVEVLSVEDHVPTVHTKPGERNPAIRANVTVLDGRQAGHVYEDALVFPKVLQGQLRSRVGKTVLGRLGQGDAKQGQNPPWKLAPATPQDRRQAEERLARAAGEQPAATGQASQAPF